MVVIQLIVLPPAPEERPDDLVDASYVARRFGCSPRSVYAGRCGTGGITPVSRDPWRATRAQVEAEHAKLVSTATAARTEPKKRLSLVRRKRSA
ncbi:MAG TPA: hypothetical protein VGX48_18765 [Pyrinomonadaceae bacterium]|jgi:hypothetical protein|nr:hypothetical protein [Pyrinomonadaceae bacterium]